MTMQAIYQGFIDEQVMLGNSSKTISYYGYCINPFLVFIGFNRENLNREHLKDYAYKLRAKGLSSQSVKSYSKGLKVFLSWLYRNGYTKKDLNLVFPLPRAQQKVIDILSYTEIHLLFNSFDTNTEIGLRNYCICGLMFDCGLRKSEVVSLVCGDLRLASGYIIVNGKGNKQRFVPVSTTLKRYILKYIGEVFMYTNVGGHLFLTEKYHEAITASCVDRLFKTLKVKIHCPRLHAHLLRHTFATLYLRNGGNIYELQKIMGHSDLDILQVYQHLSQSNILQGFNNCSPLENMYK